jgi:hypothetical protein
MTTRRRGLLKIDDFCHDDYSREKLRWLFVDARARLIAKLRVFASYAKLFVAKSWPFRRASGFTRDQGDFPPAGISIPLILIVIDFF